MKRYYYISINRFLSDITLPFQHCQRVKIKKKYFYKIVNRFCHFYLNAMNSHLLLYFFFNKKKYKMSLIN